VKDPAKPSLRRRIAVGAAGFFLLVLVLTTIFGKKGLLEIARVRRDYAALLEEIDALRREKSRLEREIAELKTSPRAVEAEARDKLWLVKPEEKVIIRK